MKLIVLLLLVVSAFAQNIESHTVPFVPPCEPGTLMFGFSRCPPVEEQGVFVHVRASGEFTAYEVTVEYRTAAGESKKAVETVKRRNDDGFHTASFVIGRVKVGAMDGITIDGVAVKKLPTFSVSGDNVWALPNAVVTPVPGTIIYVPGTLPLEKNSPQPQAVTLPLLNGRVDHSDACYVGTSNPPKMTCTGYKK